MGRFLFMMKENWFKKWMAKLKPEDQYATLFEWCDLHGKVSHFQPDDDDNLRCVECGKRTRELPEVPAGCILIWGEVDIG